jgi:hypothetical protein
MPTATDVKKPLIVPPIAVAQPTQRIDMNAAIIAYSIDVAAEQSSRSILRAQRIRSINVAIAGRMLARLESKAAPGLSVGSCRNLAGDAGITV